MHQCAAILKCIGGESWLQYEHKRGVIAAWLTFVRAKTEALNLSARISTIVVKPLSAAICKGVLSSYKEQVQCYGWTSYARLLYFIGNIGIGFMRVENAQHGFVSFGSHHMQGRPTCILKQTADWYDKQQTSLASHLHFAH